MVALEAPDEVREALEPLLPQLGQRGVERVLVFAYGRPGEPQYWLAYLFIEGRRFTLGTPDLRHELRDAQLLDLVHQIASFSGRPLPFD